jgi:hypothetical protein
VHRSAGLETASAGHTRPQFSTLRLDRLATHLDVRPRWCGGCFGGTEGYSRPQEESLGVQVVRRVREYEYSTASTGSLDGVR